MFFVLLIGMVENSIQTDISPKAVQYKKATTPTTTTIRTTRTCHESAETLSNHDKIAPLMELKKEIKTTNEVSNKTTTDKLNPRIIGGLPARANQFPYQVSIQKKINYKTKRHFCGGSIISQKVVLTAAHCFDVFAFEEKSFYAVAGLVRLTKRVSTTQYKLIASVINHPGYISSSANNDCLLAILDAPFNYNSGVQAIKPAVKRPVPNMHCEVPGWGSTVKKSSGIPSDDLYFMVINIADDDKCAEYFSVEWNYTNMLCAGGEEVDSCNGDSGGPLVCDSVQVGIVSFGTVTCGIGVPGVYTNVAIYSAWITDVARKNSASFLKVNFMVNVFIHYEYSLWLVKKIIIFLCKLQYVVFVNILK